MCANWLGGKWKIISKPSTKLTLHLVAQPPGPPPWEARGERKQGWMGWLAKSSPRPGMQIPRWTAEVQGTEDIGRTRVGTSCILPSRVLRTCVCTYRDAPLLEGDWPSVWARNKRRKTFCPDGWVRRTSGVKGGASAARRPSAATLSHCGKETNAHDSEANLDWSCQGRQSSALRVRGERRACTKLVGAIQSPMVPCRKEKEGGRPSPIRGSPPCVCRP